MRCWLAVGLLGASVAQAADMLELRYLDQDPGDAPYLTRILITPAYLRMDDGSADGDFVLLDRRQRRVVNVMRGSRLAMVFEPGQVPPRRAGWKARLTTQPGVPGTRRYRLAVNGVTCSEGVAAARGMADAARAMAELKRVLAAAQYRVWKDSPADMQHDCDLANQVWAFDAVLELGLPLQVHEYGGRTRQFQGESRKPLQADLFRVPEGMTAIQAPS